MIIENLSGITAGSLMVGTPIILVQRPINPGLIKDLWIMPLHLKTSEMVMLFEQMFLLLMLPPMLSLHTGCFGKLISQYSQSMEGPLHGSQLPHLFSSSSWRAGEASPLPLQAVRTTADQDSVLQMSRIRRLFNFVVQCHDSNSVPYSSMVS